MGKEIKNKFNESINKIKDNINNIDEKDIKKENIEILEIDEIVTYIKKNLKTVYFSWEMYYTILVNICWTSGNPNCNPS